MDEYAQYYRELREGRAIRGYEHAIDPYYRAYEDNLDRLVAAKRAQEGTLCVLFLPAGSPGWQGEDECVVGRAVVCG